MHFSRMRTGRSLTVCRSLLPGGGSFCSGGCLLPGGGVCSGRCLHWGGVCLGVSAPGGGSAPGGMSAPGGVYLGGVCSRGACLLWGVWYPSMHRGRHPPPPVNRMTNRCKNHTSATTSLRPVITAI